MRDLNPGHIDYIFDIGANLGFFSVFSKVLFPNAKVIAVEPSHALLPLLKENVNMMDVIIDERALADGSKLYFCADMHHIFDARFIKDHQDTYTVDSVTLSNLLNDYGCTKDDGYVLKFNCEGGEHFMKGDKEAESIMKNALQVEMMIHFKSILTPFKEWPEWQKIDIWVRDLFDNHYIKYHTSNKHKGRGFYHIRAFIKDN
ncbi:MAG: FkbM family methyltransferase [Candidatus Hodarchaeales archaeon]|jgi:FkbM family methyltransferase